MNSLAALLFRCGLLSASALLLAPAADAALPPVPYPAENPPTEAKRILGKALFWEEQLSSDDMVACGTCHRPAFGGADPRGGTHPGMDGFFGSADDVNGSRGVVRRSRFGHPVEDELFGQQPQVTQRLSPSTFTALWAGKLFWDGRASGEFRDPQTGELLIESGAALENQALHPILDPTEMAREERSWQDALDKLARVTPLALASDLPPDLAAGLAGVRSYSELFEAAFGDPRLSATRVAFALASYERSLVPDQTPWDRYDAGDGAALSDEQIIGLGIFMNSGGCRACHTLPLFSNDGFRATGVRPPAEDMGRAAVTGDPGDRGKFKVPSLRNAGLRPRFMHNGRFTSLTKVLDFYAQTGGEQSFPENRDPHFDVIDIPAFGRDGLLTFLRDALTDPRVANEAFPFDRPRLRSERGIVVVVVPPAWLQLDPPSPNPSPGETLFPLRLIRPSGVELSIYSPRGRKLRVLSLPPGSVGWQALRWDGLDATGRALASGVYLYEARAEEQRVSGRITLLR